MNIKKLALPALALVLGIIALVVGIHSNATKHLYDSTVKATIVDIEESWETDPDTDSQKLVKTAYIDYTVDGQKYERVLSPVQDDGFKVGDTTEILYQSGNPEKIAAPDMATTAVIFIIVGVVVTLGGLIGTALTVIRRR